MGRLKQELERHRVATAASPSDVARIRRRVERHRPTPARWFALLPTAALAAATLLALRVVPAPVEGGLAGAGEAALTGDIHVRFEGDGAFEGTTADQEIRWDNGRIHVDVTPNLGLHVAVVTPEARVTVKGTRFDVQRDPLGTRVTVQEGTVSVECVGDSRTLVGAGGDATCVPRSAAGSLARARTLLTSESYGEALDAVRIGLADPDRPPALDDELSALHAGLLLHAGRTVEARAEAERYLQRPDGARLEEVARLLLAAGGDRCLALRHLQTPTPEESAERTACPHVD